ncbi:hypothetical protein cpu_25220, partial [Carboxydothermus pertinax]
VDRPENRSQYFFKLKQALKKVGIPRVLLKWEKTKNQKGGTPT